MHIGGRNGWGAPLPGGLAPMSEGPEDSSGSGAALGGGGGGRKRSLSRADEDDGADSVAATGAGRGGRGRSSGMQSLDQLAEETEGDEDGEEAEEVAEVGEGPTPQRRRRGGERVRAQVEDQGVIYDVSSTSHFSGISLYVTGPPSL